MIEVRGSAELEQIVRESVAAIKAGDDEWFAAHMADGGDVLFYGSAPGEEWRGRDAVLGLTSREIRAWMEESDVAEEEDPAFECFEAGDTGWIVVHGNFILSDGSKVPTRGVTVMTRDAGDWKRVFAAVHVLAPNELLAPGSPLAVRES